MNRATILILTLASALCLPMRAQSDTRVDISTTASYLNPTANVIDQAGLEGKYDGGLGLGGRLTIWFNDAVALEGSGHFLGSALSAEFFGISGNVDVTMFYGSAQIVVALGPERRFLLHGGLGMQGTNFDHTITGSNIMTGVFGVSGWMPMSETVALRLDVDTHIYNQWWEYGDVRSDEITQMDVLYGIGLQFTPGGR